MRFSNVRKSKKGQSTLEYLLIWTAVALGVAAVARTMIGGDDGAVTSILDDSKEVIEQAGSRMQAGLDL